MPILGDKSEPAVTRRGEPGMRWHKVRPLGQYQRRDRDRYIGAMAMLTAAPGVAGKNTELVGAMVENTCLNRAVCMPMAATETNEASTGTAREQHTKRHEHGKQDRQVSCQRVELYHQLLIHAIARRDFLPRLGEDHASI